MRKLEHASVGSVTWASLDSFGKGKAKPSTASTSALAEAKSVEEVPSVLVPSACEESPQPLSPVFSEGEDVQSELFETEKKRSLCVELAESRSCSKLACKKSLRFWSRFLRLVRLWVESDQSGRFRARLRF